MKKRMLLLTLIILLALSVGVTVRLIIQTLVDFFNYLMEAEK